jgi:hypothetical protein
MLPQFYWNFTGPAKERHDRVAAAVRAKDYPRALRQLDAFCKELGICAGVSCCVQLDEKDARGFEAFARHVIVAPEGPWARFCVKLVSAGYIPSGEMAMADRHYDDARYMLLLIRAEKRSYVDSRWDLYKKRGYVARTAAFYPELLFRHPNRRERIRAIATMHKGLGPKDVKQTVLFSLGGFYDLNTAHKGADRQLKLNPVPGKAPGTTCFLFARSVLHAAGCNVITDKTLPLECSCRNMFELPDPIMNQAFVRIGDVDKNPPRPGDVYLIQGDDKASGHVGVIVDMVDNYTWRTVEGGASDHVNFGSTRTLTKKDPATKGRWAFENDTQTSYGRRPITGWISIDRIPPGQWMAGA